MRFKDGNSITFIPGNYLTSLRRMSRYIFWREGYNRFEATESPGTEFMSRFNKPDLVAAGLRGEKVAVVTSSGTPGSRPDNYKHYG